jgi:hypothetical protein
LILFREIVSGYWDNYQIAVGVVVIVVIMLAPRGIVGTLNGFLTLAHSKERLPEDPVEALAKIERSS